MSRRRNKRTGGPTLLDRAVSYIAPLRGARRARARFVRAQIEGLERRGYDAATRGKRLEGWSSPQTSADAEIERRNSTIRGRSHELVRNDGWAGGVVDTITSNLIGTGIRPRARAGRFDERIAELWQEWGETSACDADGLHDFYGLQDLVTRTVVESGSCLVRLRARRLSDGLPVPLQLQVLEPDHLDSARDTDRNDLGGRTIHGIQFDATGRRAGYWLFSGHPGDSSMVGGMDSSFVPADRCLHVFRCDRPGQSTGVPWMHRIAVALRDLGDYLDAQRVRQKIAACFVGFVRDLDLENAEVGVGDEDDEDVRHFEPGMFEALPAGKDVTFGNPPQVQGFDEFTRVVLREIAKGVGISYEELTGDLSRVNFSSARMGWLAFQRNLSGWRSKWVIPQLLAPVWRAFALAAELQEGLEVPPALWTPPRREMIDPSKEVRAKKEQIRAGLTTLPEAIRESGREPLELLDEVERFNEEIDARGLVLEADPRSDKGRETTPPGTVRVPAASSNGRGSELEQWRRIRAGLLGD